MNEWFAVISPISFLGILILVGFFSEKYGYVTNIRESLSRIIVNITLPVFVVTSLCSQNLNNISLLNISTVYLSGISAVLVLLIINKFVAKALKVSNERRLIHIFLGSFGNVIFLGYPVIFYLYGQIGLLYAIIFSLANDSMVWTYGVYMLKKNCEQKVTQTSNIIEERGSILTNNVKSSQLWNNGFCNAMTLSFIIGISMLILNIKLPDIINNPLVRLGEATIPLSMLFIGAILAKTNLLASVTQLSIWVLALIKMILLPIIVLLSVKLFASNISDTLIIIVPVICLQIAMPTQINLSVLAEKYKADTVYVAQTIFVTTIASALTLPLIYFLCVMFFPIQ